jgi:hypothetical protein
MSEAIPVKLRFGGKSVKGRLVLILLALPLLLGASPTDMPTPPTGFAWQEIPELKAAVLRPSGWFFKREETKGTKAYFITKESIEDGGEFQTGLTVNVFQHKKGSAVESAKVFIDQLAAKKHGEEWAKDVGPFKEFGCLTRDTDASGTTVVQTLMVANPKTNTLYLFIFESPEPSWDSAWKVGKTIFDSLILDDET